MIQYLCGNCLHVDLSDEHGNCRSCGVDDWLEREDFEHHPDAVAKVSERSGFTIEQLRLYFYPRACVDCRYGDKGVDDEPCNRCLDTDMRARSLFTSKFRKRRRKE